MSETIERPKPTHLLDGTTPVHSVCETSLEEVRQDGPYPQFDATATRLAIERHGLFLGIEEHGEGSLHVRIGVLVSGDRLTRITE